MGTERKRFTFTDLKDILTKGVAMQGRQIRCRKTATW